MDRLKCLNELYDLIYANKEKHIQETLGAITEKEKKLIRKEDNMLNVIQSVYRDIQRIDSAPYLSEQEQIRDIIFHVLLVSTGINVIKVDESKFQIWLVGALNIKTNENKKIKINVTKNSDKYFIITDYQIF